MDRHRVERISSAEAPRFFAPSTQEIRNFSPQRTLEPQPKPARFATASPDALAPQTTHRTLAQPVSGKKMPLLWRPVRGIGDVVENMTLVPLVASLKDMSSLMKEMWGDVKKEFKDRNREAGDKASIAGLATALTLLSPLLFVGMWAGNEIAGVPFAVGDYFGGRLWTGQSKNKVERFRSWRNKTLKALDSPDDF